MKYRLIAFAACAVALIIALLAVMPEELYDKRVHQHLTAAEKIEDNASSAFSTHLPLVCIDTGGIDIPGRAYEGVNGKTAYTTTEDGADRINAHMTVIDHETTYNHIEDEPTLESTIIIHVRGTSSRWFDKSGYALRLINEDGTNNPQCVMGMDAHHEWVLHGPFLDKTLMRNYVFYNIGGEIMDYAPNVRFCELMLNGEYKGVYVMVETIAAGDNGARLNLSVNAKKNTFTGYLLLLDRDTEGIKSITSFVDYSFQLGKTLGVTIEYPGRANLTEEMRRKIERSFSDFEKSLYSYDYDNEKFGWRTQIDEQSFIDYFLINEVLCNYDAGAVSTYVYKGVDGVLRMCLWDMNSAGNNYEVDYDGSQFQLQYAPWFLMLLKDEGFVDDLIERYWELRKTYLNEEYISNYIDDVVAYLGDAVDRNWEVWGYTFVEDAYQYLAPDERNPKDYNEAVAQLKDFLKVRFEWLDENIDVLRQYSAKSGVKKFNENAN